MTAGVVAAFAVCLTLVVSTSVGKADSLSGTAIRSEHNSPPYMRVQYMPGGVWEYSDDSCLDGRQKVLVAQAVPGSLKLTNDGCSVISGNWIDPYTGEQLTDPEAIDIDHLVALKEAHVSGGYAWSPEKRRAFAQDLTDGNLFAVSRVVNRAKGDKDPAKWLPPRAAFRCTYVEHWIHVKQSWHLSMDEKEFHAVRKVLDGCNDPTKHR